MKAKLAAVVRPKSVASVRDIAQQKTSWWQTESGANFFVTNSDAAQVPSAHYMDRVVNTFFLRYCEPGTKVLDVGCGHGIVSLFLARHGSAVTACDVSEPLLERLRENAGRVPIRIVRADAHALPFSDGEFDVVLSRMFLGHFADWPDVLREMSRCCRKGGWLLVHFTSKENWDMASHSCPQKCDFGEVGSIAEAQGREGLFFAAVDLAMIEKHCAPLGLRVSKRAPVTFFHCNRLFGHALGTAAYQQYRKELDLHLKNPAVLDFVAWFERTAVERLPVWTSYYNILVLEKL